jgi:LPS-assembly protein
MTKWTLGYSYPIALTISLVPALSPLMAQAAPLNATRYRDPRQPLL